MIGNGSSSAVYAARKGKRLNQECVAKVFKENSKNYECGQKYIFQAIFKRSKLCHPAILRFGGINFASFEDPKLQPTIFLEYCENGTFRDIKKNIENDFFYSLEEWTPTKKYISLIGISHGMYYLHENGYENINLDIEKVLFDSFL